MLNKVIDVLDDFDFERVTETVDMVWDDREKILGSVDLVWENRDDIMDAVNYVLSHRTVLANLFDKLPELLATTGDYIEAAGASAVRASEFLTGADGEEGLSVRDLAELAAKALDRCQDELEDVAGFIDRLGDSVDGITIPSIEPQFTDVMGFSVISGIELGENNLVDDAGEQLQKGSKRLTEMGKEFVEVASHLRTLGVTVTDAGGDLNNVGSQLAQSGDMLRGILGLGIGSVEADPKAKKSTKKSSASSKSKSATTTKRAPKAPSTKRKAAVAKRTATKKPARKSSRLSKLKSKK